MGPTISIDFNVGYSYDLSETTEASASSTYAKDVMDRSLERVSERVRQERITKILKENETTNTHSFTNVPNEITPVTDIEHVSGIYQFIDKIYKAQVFNYGKRQMFDIMIPEPASFIRYLNEKGNAENISELEKVPPFDLNPFDIKYDNHSIVVPGFGSLPVKEHYTNLGKLYKAQGFNPPPGDRIFTFSHQQPDSTTGDGERASESDRGPLMLPPKVIEVSIEEDTFLSLSILVL